MEDKRIEYHQNVKHPAKNYVGPIKTEVVLVIPTANGLGLAVCPKLNISAFRLLACRPNCDRDSALPPPLSRRWRPGFGALAGFIADRG